jgi:4-amino-4-deoxy-L-arabinose transferase-like glycosyltransferase
MSRRSFNLALGAIITLALAVRVFAAFEVNSIVPQSDAADFDRHALSIAAGDGYPDALTVTGGPGPSAFRAPLYPLVLAAVYTVINVDDDSARWLGARLEQALIGTAVVALIALIAFQLWGRRLALIAAAIAAVYLPLIHAGTSLLTEPLFTALLLAGVAALLRYRLTDQRTRWLAAAGVFAGLAALTRGNGLAVVVALALGAWIARPRLSMRSLSAPAIVVGCAVLVVAPWTIRNAIVVDAFVPVTDQTGIAIGGQYNDVSKANDWSWVGPWGVPAFSSLYAGPPPGEVELSRELTDRGVDYALDHPGAVVSVVVHNTLRLFGLRDPVGLERSSAPVVGEPQGLAQAGVYAFWALALVAIGGAFTPAARRLPAFVWAIVALLVASVVFVGGSARYRAPLEPIFILLAALAVDWVYGRLKPATKTEWPTGNETLRSSGSSAANTA